MNTWSRPASSLAALLLAGVAAAQRLPEIAYVFPAGMQRGTSVEVTVGGRDLQRVTAAHFTHAGVVAEIVERKRPMTGRERLEAQDELGALVQKQRQEKLTTEELATVRELRAKIAESRRQVSPQLVESVRLRLTAAGDAVTGAQDLRLLSPDGLSNPLRFVVGTLPERLEPEDRRGALETLPTPVVVNGQILERDVDRVRFRVQEGANLVAVVEARSLIPFLADAVPGWFQAYLTLRTADGAVVRTVDDRGFDPDPVLHWVVDTDGVVELEIGDAVCRGREDFVYRLTVGELPYVGSVFPLGARAGRRARATLRGFNLETTVAEVDLTERERGVVELDAEGVRDPLPFAVDECRETCEAEPNNDEPQGIAVPILVNGVIDRPGDIDVYALRAPGGTRLVAEVTARRLGSPLDSLLRLVDSKGREVARCDDTPDTASGLDTQAADSRLEFVLHGGGYRLVVGDVQRKGSPEHAYRLYVGPPQPDFELRVTPSSIAAGPGGTAVVSVHVTRLEGFDGDVELRLVDAPPGWSLGGAIVPAGTDRVDVTVTAAGLQPGEVVPVAIEGHASIRRRDSTRRAVPCDDRMQAFIYRHLVPADQLLCTGRRGMRIALPVPELGRKALRLSTGETAKLVLAAPGRRGRRELRFELRDPPEGIRIARTDERAQTYVLAIEVDRRDDLRGLRGNLIIDVTWQAPAGEGQRRAGVRGTLAAVPFVVRG